MKHGSAPRGCVRQDNKKDWIGREYNWPDMRVNNSALVALEHRVDVLAEAYDGGLPYGVFGLALEILFDALDNIHGEASLIETAASHPNNRSRRQSQRTDGPLDVPTAISSHRDASGKSGHRSVKGMP